VKTESPCIKLCLLENNVCVSCHRTRDQISSWINLTSEQRKEIMNDLALRRNEQKDVDSR